MEFFVWDLVWDLELVDNCLREIERQRETAEQTGALREQIPMLRKAFHALMLVADDLIARARDAGIPAEDLSLLGAV